MTLSRFDRQLAIRAYAQHEPCVLSEDHAQILLSYISSLPEQEQRLLSLYYEHGLSRNDAAVALNVPESDVSFLHARCITQLKRLYAASKGSPPLADLAHKNIDISAKIV